MSWRLEQVVEEVAENLEEAAEVTRQQSIPELSDFLVGGFAVGVAVGFYFGHRWNKEKIRAEAFKKSEEEVEKIREVSIKSRRECQNCYGRNRRLTM